MPIKLKDTDSGSDIVLDIVEYKEEYDVRYFRVRNSEDIGINFKYIPISTSTWNKEGFELYLLENSYLDAENDVFEVYEDSITEERIGWIFPITILESNDNEFTNSKNLNDYKYIAYQKLLELNTVISSRDFSGDFVKLSDIFKNVIVCILCKKTIDKIINFSIDSYILSLYKCGYLLLDDIPKSKAIYDRKEFVKDMRQRKRITITKAKFDISANDFTKSLFKEHLLQSEHYIIRFIFLYQIIEHLMDLEFDNQFKLHLEEYQNKKLTKNDLKENILTSTRERDLINSVFNRSAIKQELKGDFIQECDFLFNDLGLSLNSKKNFPDKIYDLRNLITHSLRELTTKSESLKKITEIFEQIIVELLINYKTIT